MPDFSTIDNRCYDSWHILISCQFKHGYPLNISWSKIFDSCKIKCMLTNLTQLGYANNYYKNRYLEKNRKQLYMCWLRGCKSHGCINMMKSGYISKTRPCNI